MADKKVDLSGAFEEARANVKDELKDVTDEGHQAMTTQIREEDAMATETLHDSVQTHVRAITGGIRASVGPDAKPGSNEAPYAHFVDQGTRPHWAPIQPLKRWARTKHSATGQEKTAIAYAAQWAIAQRGTEAVEFTDVALREMKDGLTERIEKAIARAFD